MKTLLSVLRKYRADHHLSQDKLASLMGVSQTTIHFMETGERPLSLRDITLLAIVTDCDEELIKIMVELVKENIDNFLKSNPKVVGDDVVRVRKKLLCELAKYVVEDDEEEENEEVREVDE